MYKFIKYKYKFQIRIQKNIYKNKILFIYWQRSRIFQLFQKLYN